MASALGSARSRANCAASREHYLFGGHRPNLSLHLRLRRFGRGGLLQDVGHHAFEQALNLWAQAVTTEPTQVTDQVGTQAEK